MATTLKPLGDRVVVQPRKKEEMTSSGIVLPDTASEKPQEGSVLAVGPGRVLDNGKRVEMEVKSGDTVLFGLMMLFSFPVMFAAAAWGIAAAVAAAVGQA